LVKNINIFDAILNIDAILIFQDWQQFFYNRTEQVVKHIQNLEHFIPQFRYQKFRHIKFFGHFEFLRFFFFVKCEQLAKFKQY
jgi:hypothetical protein